MEPVVVSLIAVAIALFAVLNARRVLAQKSVSDALKVGQPLPEFQCKTESGDTVTSGELAGNNSVLLFVRGSWCPFCSEQVKAVTDHYRKITEAGGRLIIVTRKPLAITQRVAEQFGVDFEFWLDENLDAATQLELVDDEHIPDRFHDDYGRRTIRPTVLVTDKSNIIQYGYRSAKASDRPDPQLFMTVFEKLG
ncbi:MAG: redoxin domain-containing protein [Woeseiaceae bacterium]